MKKVLFWVSLIFSLLVLNEVPSFAMGFTVSPEMIGGLGDLGYSLLGGASFDFTDTEYSIENYDNLSEQLKAEAADKKAREFLQAYCMARGIPIPNVDPDLPTSNLKDFYKSQYFNSANRSVWNNYKLAQNVEEQSSALRFPIGPQAFADWAEYNVFWYNKYIDSFYSDDVISVDPDPNYLNYIENINGSGFYWKNWANTNNENNSWPGLYYYPPSKTSWFNKSNVISTYDDNSNYHFGYFTTNIYNIYITSTNDIYSFNFSISNEEVLNNVYYNNVTYKNIYIRSLSDSFGISNFNNTVNADYLSWSYSGSLSDVLNYLQQHVRNVNLYVDGIAWSLAGAPANPLIPTFPDVIGGTDEDPYPAYDIVFPNTSDYEGNFDLTSIFDAIKEAIIGASDTDSTTSGSLTRDKVSDTFKDKVGEAVGETTKTIDDVLTDSFPVQGSLNYPAIPPIPELPINNAFMGTTILAQLIDACQHILPEPLTLVFWGIIFILFIIGLIKILHK